MPRQQFVILSPETSSNGGLSPIGSREEIVKQLGDLNTSPEKEGGDMLYGPGIRIELPPGEPVTQMLMTLTEEDIAWHVVMRLVKQMKWKLLDPMSGRELKP